MKKQMIFGLLSAVLLFSACDAEKISKIGGADGPAGIGIEKQARGEAENWETKSVKMVNLGGALYYETGKESERSDRCGVMDGTFQKGVERFCIPQNDGETNFDGSAGYQIGVAENTVEILIEDNWEIFEKIDTDADVFQYAYCYVVEGRLPNAENDNAYLVFAHDKAVTFEEAANRLIGSVADETKDIYVLPVLD